MGPEDKKIQEIQMLEQTLHNLSFQKQSFQLELFEVIESLSSLQSSGEEVFKIIGQLMIRADKKKAQEELLNKQKLLELRIKSFEKEEDSLSKKIVTLREELIKQKK
ncbi:MAG: prefoldin subunit [archaeon]